MNNDMSEEQIHQQMQETHASLIEKLELLENKVMGTVENATTAVNETVNTLKDTVQDTVTSVQEGVKGSVDQVKGLVDVPAHVQERPWLMMGGAVAVGYCLGTLLTKSASSHRMTAPPARPAWMASPAIESALPPAVPQQPSVWDTEITKLKGLALGVLFGTAREMLVSSLPEQLGEQIKEVVDSVTKKVGGEPLASSDWNKLHEAVSTPTTEATLADPATTRRQNQNLGNGYTAGRRH